jgi:protein ImuA
MSAAKKAIIEQLQQELLLLQGFKPPSNTTVQMGLGALEKAFPNAVFPAGAIHEFLSDAVEHTAATGGFVAGLLGRLMQRGGACIWISATRTLFPPALKAFGVIPDQVVFVDLQREKDVLWATEEALKCEGLAAVVAELKDISFTASRRLQLATEQSRVTGFLLRHQPRDLNAIACVARWRITPLASVADNGMPGVGFPRWQVGLVKVRNGKPGTWQVEWAANRFRVITENTTLSNPVRIRKIG